MHQPQFFEGQKRSPSQRHWEKRASIRTRPRRLIDLSDANPHFMPPVKQPLLSTPYIAENFTQEQECALLIHTLYKYMNDIATIETSFISNVCLKMIADSYSFSFSRELKNSLLTVVIDEAYHAYVALDFLAQVEEYTTVKPLAFPKEITLTQTTERIKGALPQHLQADFECLSVCLAEHALTYDLIETCNMVGVKKIFHQVMQDHIIDEARHTGIFEEVLTVVWQQLHENDREIMAAALKSWFEGYFSNALDKQYYHGVLVALGVDSVLAQTLVGDTYFEMDFRNVLRSNPSSQKIMDLLHKTGILAHPAARELAECRNRPFPAEVSL